MQGEAIRLAMTGVVALSAITAQVGNVVGWRVDNSHDLQARHRSLEA